jgi:type I restriction enzyme S subunit
LAIIKALKLKNETHRLGDYIREVNVRNRELKVTEPMGINIDKHFMPSVANVIGTDLSTYKLVSKNQFACNLMHVGRDEKIPMAMQTNDNPIIVSPAYFVFEVTKPDELLPEYLMMWFCRKEFDRNAWFYTDADVRGGLDKEALMDMQLPVPNNERQREIVSEYETLTHRIRLNEQMIEKLEATAQALYRHTFVDNIDKQNLPQGWHLAKLGNVCKLVDEKISLADIKESVYISTENMLKDKKIMNKSKNIRKKINNKK